MFQTYYIPPDNLAHLHRYKYSGVDHSLLSKYVLQPYWSRLVLLFPTWMAPNLITLIGLSFIIANVATLLWFDPTLDGECPRWVYFTWAAGLFAYSSLDAIDGKQARRTGTSGPLGQLFDHGCDALNVALGSLLASEAGHLGGSYATLIGLIGAQLNFYVSTWEEYHTGTLYLSAFSGPVEGVMILIGMLVVTGFTGPGFWDQGLDTMLAVKAFPSWPVKYVLLAVSQITVLINLLSSARNIYVSLKDQSTTPPTDASHTHWVSPSPMRVLGRLLPAFHIPILLIASTYLQPTLLHGRLMVPVILYLGFAFSYFVGRIIVAHVTAMRFPRGNTILTPWFLYTALLVARRYVLTHDSAAVMLGPGANMVMSLTEEGLEGYWVIGALVWGGVVYGWFAYRVIQDICQFLDIWCLRIKYYGQERPEKKQA